MTYTREPCLSRLGAAYKDALPCTCHVWGRLAACLHVLSCDAAMRHATYSGRRTGKELLLGIMFQACMHENHPVRFVISKLWRYDFGLQPIEVCFAPGHGLVQWTLGKVNFAM